MAKISYLSIIWALVVPSLAQTNRLFQWGFANEALSTSLPTCTPLPIIVKSFDPTTNSTNGTPPYYMIAFAVDGTPQTAFIGTDENNLSFSVTHPVDSRLILSVVDANGSAGGVPPQIFQIIPGQTTQCVVNPPSNPTFQVSANVTTDLFTCQPWGLTVTGGVPPYTVTLVAPNSPVITNVTMPFGLDRFTFIDRADPKNVLIGAVSDLTGKWAAGTPIVNTKGSSDISCVGLVSSSGNSTIIKEASNAASHSTRHRSIVIGLSVSFAVITVLALGSAAFLYVHKRRRQSIAELEKVLPRQYIETETQELSNSINKFLPSNDEANPRPLSEKTLVMIPGSFDHSLNAALLTPAPSPQNRNGQALRPGFTNFPVQSIRRSAANSRESRVVTASSPDSEYSNPPGIGQSAKRIYSQAQS